MGGASDVAEDDSNASFDFIPRDQSGLAPLDRFDATRDLGVPFGAQIALALSQAVGERICQGSAILFRQSEGLLEHVLHFGGHAIGLCHDTSTYVAPK